MTLHSPSALGLLLCSLVLAACPDNGSGSSETGTSETSAPGTSTTTGQPPTSTTADDTTGPPPTSSTTEATTDVGTSTTTTGDPDTGGSSTTGAPAMNCVDYTNKNACEFDDACKWDTIFSFNRGLNGCQADLIEFCVEDKVGSSSTWYRGEPGSYEVLTFETTPEDLPPEWKPCDCEGPLACLCAPGAPECPDRLGEFCDITKNQAACKNSAINNEFKCAWASISPEGPKDDMCTTQLKKDVCIPADNAGSSMCNKIDYTMPYPDLCFNKMSRPVYWRENNGVIEVTAICGPVPLAPEWTLCEGVDTPDQPDECKCGCDI
ncbi:MAG: hypothetical protein JNL82_39230 [Myxococcales bacterium]|nr:hypothetical protein [Myxococcales bacterium]